MTDDIHTVDRGDGIKLRQPGFGTQVLGLHIMYTIFFLSDVHRRTEQVFVGFTFILKVRFENQGPGLFK